ncbi:hypothetical protein [Maridesulfovibrio hydrothermalis]|uniref:Uncharacterized protein n=1 Tax=Maridesulfovibrio hydrothermalis AM13 = DSM 14728 TaxID=1121451 RepID=L0R5Q1_9BACT|nr:hypothetical protein [Maridesulfovibrio hydrothermalis]CCO22008.1 protein of unknown function [Maridesulfovibrio hydrothermalis AM13 = DSM 14728]
MEKTPLFTEKEYSDTFKLLVVLIMGVALETNLAARCCRFATILAIFPAGFFLEGRSRIKKKKAQQNKALQDQPITCTNILPALPKEQNLLRRYLLLSTMFLILLQYDLKGKKIQTKPEAEIITKPRKQQSTIAIPLPCSANSRVKPSRVDKWERDKDLKNHYEIALDKILAWEKSVNEPVRTHKEALIHASRKFFSSYFIYGVPTVSREMFFKNVSDYMKKTPSIKFIEKRAAEAWQYLPVDLKLHGGTTAKSQNKERPKAP